MLKILLNVFVLICICNMSFTHSSSKDSDLDPQRKVFPEFQSDLPLNSSIHLNEPNDHFEISHYFIERFFQFSDLNPLDFDLLEYKKYWKEVFQEWKDHGIELHKDQKELWIFQLEQLWLQYQHLLLIVPKMTYLQIKEQYLKNNNSSVVKKPLLKVPNDQYRISILYQNLNHWSWSHSTNNHQEDFLELQRTDIFSVSQDEKEVTNDSLDQYSFVKTFELSLQKLAQYYRHFFSQQGFQSPILGNAKVYLAEGYEPNGWIHVLKNPLQWALKHQKKILYILLFKAVLVHFLIIPLFAMIFLSTQNYSFQFKIEDSLQYSNPVVVILHYYTRASDYIFTRYRILFFFSLVYTGFCLFITYQNWVVENRFFIFLSIYLTLAMVFQFLAILPLVQRIFVLPSELRKSINDHFVTANEKSLREKAIRDSLESENEFSSGVIRIYIYGWEKKWKISLEDLWPVLLSYHGENNRFKARLKLMKEFKKVLNGPISKGYLQKISSESPHVDQLQWIESTLKPVLTS
jgi:hypothetical protein